MQLNFDRNTIGAQTDALGPFGAVELREFDDSMAELPAIDNDGNCRPTHIMPPVGAPIWIGRAGGQLFRAVDLARAMGFIRSRVELATEEADGNDGMD